MYIKHGKSLVEHHIHYKEIDGYDQTVLLKRSEHAILHKRLRLEGRCNIHPKKLNLISIAAHNRSHREDHYPYNAVYSKQNWRIKTIYSMSNNGVYIRVRAQINSKTGYLGIHTTHSFNGRPERDYHG